MQIPKLVFEAPDAWLYEEDSGKGDRHGIQNVDNDSDDDF